MNRKSLILKTGSAAGLEAATEGASVMRPKKGSQKTGAKRKCLILKTGSAAGLRNR